MNMETDFYTSMQKYWQYSQDLMNQFGQQLTDPSPVQKALYEQQGKDVSKWLETLSQHPETMIKNQSEWWQSQIQILQQDLADIQTKVGSLEIDDTRLDQIEQDVESVVEASHILVSEMENIRLEANRFQGFLDSLMELLNNLNETETAIP